EALQRKHADGARGFTLIELLVVITILGILAAIVVFSVNGLGSKGQTEANQTQISILRTAEEAHYAKNGVYASADGLKAAGLIANLPDQGSATVVISPDGKTFVIGSPLFPSSTGDLQLGSGNLEAVFKFLSTSAPTAVIVSTASSSTQKTLSNNGTGTP